MQDGGGSGDTLTTVVVKEKTMAEGIRSHSEVWKSEQAEPSDQSGLSSEQ